MSGLPDEILDLKDMDPHARLQTFFTAIIDGIINYPGITKAHLYNPLMQNDYSTIFVRRFNAFLNDLLSRMKGVRAREKEEDLKITIVQIISAIVLPSLMPRLFRTFVKINFQDEKMKEAYVANLLDHFFK